MHDKIPLGISACLLGNNVRFDGGHKRFAFADEQLAPYVQFEPVCPEMSIGLPVPRPALRLVKSDEGVTLRFSQDQTEDLTERMQSWAVPKVASLSHLAGFLVCAKSPSCGLERVRVYSSNGKDAKKSGIGLFTSELLNQYPWLPVEEEGRLNDPLLRENFIERIFALHELNQLRQQGLSRGKLVEFHSRYKLCLLAHSQPAYRQLGTVVANIAQWQSLDSYFVAYREQFMTVLAQKATRRNHTNVLMHVQGYFSRQLNATQRHELTDLIHRYRSGVQPLLAPITLLKHYLSQYPNAYLATQRYFDPYPESLKLRYGH
jgi:uncharacterized protein YbgA (DUF1722 family)/uncharacterized protein YbbK (DUF523 family)